MLTINTKKIRREWAHTMHGTIIIKTKKKYIINSPHQIKPKIAFKKMCLCYDEDSTYVRTYFIRHKQKILQCIRPCAAQQEIISNYITLNTLDCRHCAHFRQKEFCILLPPSFPSANHRAEKTPFYYLLTRRNAFFRFGIFHFLFYSRTVYVCHTMWERGSMCDAQHKEISPWPLLSIWPFVYWLIPSKILL